jgi:hypothetical protein
VAVCAVAVITTRATTNLVDKPNVSVWWSGVVRTRAAERGSRELEHGGNV